MRSANIFFNNTKAGTIIQNESGFTFTYFDEYLKDENARAISLTLPLRKEPYKSNYLFPFFNGLIPEGWLLDLACSYFNLNRLDHMSILLKTGKDVIGNVVVEDTSNE